MKKIMILCLTLGTTLAMADEASHRKLAEEALACMDVQRNIEQSFEAVKKMQMAQLKNMGMSAGDAEKTRVLQDEIMTMIQQEFTWDKVKDDYIQIYADTFTEEELNGLIEFYKSPTGKKFTEKMPDLMQKSMQISQKQMQNIMPKVQEISRKFAEEHKAAAAALKGQPIGPRLTAPAPAPASTP